MRSSLPIFVLSKVYQKGTGELLFSSITGIAIAKAHSATALSIKVRLRLPLTPQSRKKFEQTHV